MTQQLENRTVLVTGANGGLGTEFVRQALERGARRVYAAARAPREWDDERIVPLRLDVTDPSSIAAAAAEPPTSTSSSTTRASLRRATRASRPRRNDRSRTSSRPTPSARSGSPPRSRPCSRRTAVVQCSPSCPSPPGSAADRLRRVQGRRLGRDERPAGRARRPGHDGHRCDRGHGRHRDGCPLRRPEGRARRRRRAVVRRGGRGRVRSPRRRGLPAGQVDALAARRGARCGHGRGSGRGDQLTRPVAAHVGREARCRLAPRLPSVTGPDGRAGQGPGTATRTALIRPARVRAVTAGS